MSSKNGIGRIIGLSAPVIVLLAGLIWITTRPNPMDANVGQVHVPPKG